MANRNYICAQCGALRRAHTDYPVRGKTTWDDVKASKSWPKHCDAPMKYMTYEQGEAATQIEPHERVAWIRKGMHILRRGGKHTWRPALSDAQVEEVRREEAERRRAVAALWARGRGWFARRVQVASARKRTSDRTKLL